MARPTFSSRSHGRPGHALMGSAFFVPPAVTAERVARVHRTKSLLAGGAQMHPREAVQHLIQAILKATHGAIRYDATALRSRMPSVKNIRRSPGSSGRCCTH